MGDILDFTVILHVFEWDDGKFWFPREIKLSRHKLMGWFSGGEGKKIHFLCSKIKRSLLQKLNFKQVK